MFPSAPRSQQTVPVFHLGRNAARHIGQPMTVVPAEKSVLVATVDLAGDQRIRFSAMISVLLSLLLTLAKLRAFARRAAARGAGVAAPAAGAAAVAASAAAARAGGPPALGLAVPRLERVAHGARHRQTGDRHRLAPPRLPLVLDVEEPPADRATDRALRRPRADSDACRRPTRSGALRGSTANC